MPDFHNHVSDEMILICYDGSPDSQAAIDRAASLFPGAPTTVLTVWESFADVLARTGGLTVWPDGVDIDRLDASTEQGARDRAAEGAERARRAGLHASARTCRRGLTISSTILAEAEAIDAEPIVIGTRGLGGLKSLLLGSVSHALVQHADRSVVVVPSPELAARRSEQRR